MQTMEALAAAACVRQVCETCGSVNVTCDALARWSEELQQWELAGELQNTDCDDCGGQATLKEVPISADDPICECQNCDWRGLRSHLKDIIDYNERVEPGEEKPDGECPICKALAHAEGN